MLIEIYSDVICPWCFIGKRRLDAALATSAGQGVEVAWRPYPLYPNLPANGMDRGEYLKRRYGESAGRAEAPRRIIEEGSDAGIAFNYAAIARMPNTLAAHRLLEDAAEGGHQHTLAETLFRFYFCDGRDVGDLSTLCEAAGESGMDAAKARELLASNRGEITVRRRIGQAFERGVAGVPCYLLGGGFMLPGAQSSDTMAQFIQRAKAKLAEGAAAG